MRSFITEDEAKKKLCPMAFTARAVLLANSKSTQTVPTTCEASSCMWWGWYNHGIGRVSETVGRCEAPGCQ